MVKFNLVILDKIILNPADIETLKKHVNVIEYKTHPKNKKEILKRIKNADGIFFGFTSLDNKLLDKCKKLKYVEMWGGRAPLFVDEDHFKKRNIVFQSIPNYQYAISPVAEFIFAELFKIMTPVYKFQDIVDGKIDYSEIKRFLLKGKTIGIIGFGNAGRKVAEKAQAFKMNVVVHTKHPEKYEQYKSKNIIFVDLPTLLEKSDVVTIHLPLNRETKKFIGRKELKTFIKNKEFCILINTSRGEIVDNNALIELLRTNGNFFAIIDIYPGEFPIKKDIPELKNLRLTDHIAWFSKESIDKKSKVTIKNFLKWYKNFRALGTSP